MTGMNSLVLAPFAEDSLSRLEQLGRVTYEPWTETRMLHDPEDLGRRIAAEGFEVLVVEADFVFEELFSTASTLRFVAICRAALNHVDLDAATGHLVTVVHTPGRNAQAVAELVFALMLSLARQMPHAADYVRNAAWQDPSEPYIRFRGRELAGATLGVIGFGDIGKRVAQLAHKLSMRLLVHDPYVPRTPRYAKMASLDHLLSESNFISLHVPDTPGTQGMLSAERIGLMHKRPYLVNVTSPWVVDQAALLNALQEGRLAGVALDVHESHPIAPNSPFLALAKAGHNILLTPHIGGATLETVERHSRMVIEDLQRFRAGLRPKRLANPDVWRHISRR